MATSEIKHIMWVDYSNRVDRDAAAHNGKASMDNRTNRNRDNQPLGRQSSHPVSIRIGHGNDNIHVRIANAARKFLASGHE
jgi:hypothetical protein